MKIFTKTGLVISSILVTVLILVSVIFHYCNSWQFIRRYLVNGSV